MSQTEHTWSFESCIRALVLNLMIVKIMCVHYSLYYSSWNDILEWPFNYYEIFASIMIMTMIFDSNECSEELWICLLYSYGIILWISSLLFIPWSGVVKFEQLILTLSIVEFHERVSLFRYFVISLSKYSLYKSLHWADF